MRIERTAIAVPRNEYSQQELKGAASRIFRGMRGLDRLIEIFDNAGIRRRRLVRPLPYYAEPRPFGERNGEAVAAALELAREAIDALEVPVEAIDRLILTTTTNLATPSLDALLVASAGLSPAVRRVPLFGLGCAGGAASLGIAAQQRGGPGRTLVLSVEVCSLCFQIDEKTPLALVGAALFADGAAAAVLDHADGGPRIVAGHCELLPDSENAMGWEFDEQGMRLVLDRSVPALVRAHAKPVIERFLASRSLSLAVIDHFIIHPGGPKVIEACAEALDLTEEKIEPVRSFLAEHGNLSSASVLFMLHRLLRGVESRTLMENERALMISFGPGFAIELVLLEG